MALYRNNYQKHLAMLEQFYDQQGNHLKAGWAAAEAEHLRSGPQREYLMVAELAGPDLRAATSIVEADMLYGQAMQLFKKGRGIGGDLKLLRDKKKLYLAIDKFNEVITTYPTSDKIDDSAFQTARIYDNYLNDYPTALMYYQARLAMGSANPPTGPVCRGAIVR